MITTKLKKDSRPQDLMIEFSSLALPSCLDKLLANCREEGVLIRKSHQSARQVNMFTVEQQGRVEVKGVALENPPSEFSFVMKVIYQRSEEEEQALGASPVGRTLLVREGLDSKFHFDYEWQNTQSEQQSLVFLCQLCASVINCRQQRQLGFYDQKPEEIKGLQHLSPVQRLWSNTIYQIPGLGKEKCNSVIQQFPTFQSLYEDWKGGQNLKNILVGKGTKEAKLGSVLAGRIYRCLFNENGHERVNPQ